MTKYHLQMTALTNGKEILLRNLEPSDVEEYQYFSDSIANETTHTLHYKGQIISSDVLKERFQASIDSPWQLELGGFDQDKLISHLSFYKTRPLHPFEQHTIEFAIKIRKNYCSSGLGSKLLLIMEELARKMKVKRIQALVRTSNSIGTSFYKKHGYEIEGVKKYAVLINESYENEFYIAKILD